MKAKVIVDNVSDGNIKGEWGLCIYIEYNDKKILLDTGASGLFEHNAEMYGINLNEIDMAVLSHAHSDHANGMERFFQNNDKAKFYMRNGAEENCYAKKFIFYKYIGISKGMIKKYSDRIVFVTGDYKLCDGVYLIPHKTEGLESIGKREKMYVRKNGAWIPDDFSHEQSLVFDTENGLVIFNSCSHGGAGAIINEIKDVFPDKHVHALIGGFHLFNKSEKEILELAGKIRETKVNYLCTGHCTGQKAYDILKNELGDVIHQFHVGLSMEF
jgi:7,8-dihydropterin-6-yl-methyl-4-(beta-D-ribofuranosyl)aminobenzene 5'-phosphate synthase